MNGFEFLLYAILIIVVGDVALKYVSCKKKKERKDNE